MKYELNGRTRKTSKLITNLLYFYWLDNKIVSCRWKNPEKANMSSNDKGFLAIPGLLICNDRK